MGMDNRATVIFGNGVGMALDPEYFLLKTGLHSVWNNSKLLNEEQKALIRSALPKVTDDAYPESEEMLDDVQVAIFASELLQEFEVNDVEWLNQNSREIVSSFKRFIHKVGLYFQSSNQKLPDEFADPFVEYIKSTKSHIAVLNYDNLIYDSLCVNKVLDAYRGTLIDGYNHNTFSPKALDRYGSNMKNLGWFLNLHGSPLFVGDDKLSGAGRDFLEPNEKCHIVLTHVRHKPYFIKSSNVLTEYWSRLERALRESKKIVLFGYSGLDKHLNDVITKYSVEKRVTIVEWDGVGTQESRTNFWMEALDWEGNFDLIHKDNILEFMDWHLLK